MAHPLSKAFPRNRIEKEKRIELIMGRLLTPVIERVPQSDEKFCKNLGFTYVTYLSDRRKIEELWAKDKGVDDKTKAMNRLWELVMNKGGSENIKTLLKILGVYKEKSEVKVDFSISADELIRRNLRAETELSLEGYRVEEVPIEPPVLSEELCVGTGQDSTGDSTVGRVGTSIEDSGEGTGVAQPTTSPKPTLSDGVQISADRA